jgi:hypothetical protein
MQTKKLWMNKMTTNLPTNAKMATAMVVLAAEVADMVVVQSKRRVWMGRWWQLLQCNHATNPQQNGRQRPVVIPATVQLID